MFRYLKNIDGFSYVVGSSELDFSTKKNKEIKSNKKVRPKQTNSKKLLKSSSNCISFFPWDNYFFWGKKTENKNTITNV
jgi:hypothetical protein